MGFGLGIGPLAAYLVGAIAAGTLMAVFLANSGGAWDNAKKMVEDGAYGGKGSEAHAATVIGDTVGDPFKDTAGPAINPLIKVMNLVALIIAPAVVTMSVGDDASTAAAGDDRPRSPCWSSWSPSWCPSAGRSSSAAPPTTRPAPSPPPLPDPRTPGSSGRQPAGRRIRARVWTRVAVVDDGARTVAGRS